MSASSPALPYTQSTPQAHIIASDAEALAIAHEIAAVLKPGAAERDRTGIVPAEIVNTYSNSGLWGITVPRRFGGAEVSAATLAQVIAIVSAADPSLGQIPQNHYCLLEDIRLQGSDEQQAFFFAQVLQGYRFANALSETGGKTVLDIRTRIEEGAGGLRINGRKGYCTGSLYAHWIGILALDADERAQLAFVPHDSPGLTVVNDWACLGQRTTASGTVLADNLPVNPFHLFPTWKSYASDPRRPLRPADHRGDRRRYRPCSAGRYRGVRARPRPAVDRRRCGAGERRSADYLPYRPAGQPSCRRRRAAGTGGTGARPL